MDHDYLSINTNLWDVDAKNWIDVGQRLWGVEVPEWGNWGISDNDLKLLPSDMAGIDAVELGCGTGYVSGWMFRRGAQVTAIDISAEQLATARELASQHKAKLTFIQGNAEATGLPGTSFDFVISEYGASIWCPAEIWLREAWRLLRPGGRLVFLGNHPLSLVCSPLDGSPAELKLHRPYRGMWGADWTDVEYEPSGICFNLAIADWIGLFLEVGFEIIKYDELYAPEHLSGTRAAIPADWAKRYPVEHVWQLRKPD